MTTERILENSYNYHIQLKKNNEILRNMDKNNVNALKTKEKEILNTIKNNNIPDDSIDFYQYTDKDDEYIFIEYLENKKIQFLEIENELVELKNTFEELCNIVKNSNDDFEIIENNISLAKDRVSHTELDLLCAKVSDESYMSNHVLILSAILSGITVIGYMTKKIIL